MKMLTMHHYPNGDAQDFAWIAEVETYQFD
jgi:hypothetical protein